MAPPRGSVGTRSECEMANRFFRSRRTTGARRTSFISLFSLPTRSSVCEGDDHVVTDRFDSVHVQRKFRGKILRLACLKRSEEHTSELQSHHDLVCRLLLE